MIQKNHEKFQENTRRESMIIFIRRNFIGIFVTPENVYKQWFCLWQNGFYFSDIKTRESSRT